MHIRFSLLLLFYYYLNKCHLHLFYFFKNSFTIGRVLCTKTEKGKKRALRHGKSHPLSKNFHRFGLYNGMISISLLIKNITQFMHKIQTSNLFFTMIEWRTKTAKLNMVPAY